MVVRYVDGLTQRSASFRTDQAAGEWISPGAGRVPLERWADEWLTAYVGRAASTQARARAALRAHISSALRCRPSHGDHPLRRPAELRKIIKNRGHFPNDDADIKLLWLAIRDIEDKRARQRAAEKGTARNKRKARRRLVEGAVTQGWKPALAALLITLPDRVEPHIRSPQPRPLTQKT